MVSHSWKLWDVSIKKNSYYFQSPGNHVKHSHELFKKDQTTYEYNQFGGITKQVKEDPTPNGATPELQI